MSGAVTKEGVTVRVGQVWKDLDDRLGGRTCVVTHVGSIGPGRTFARMKRIDRAPGARVVETRVRVDRMHKGATGWALEKDVAA